MSNGRFRKIISKSACFLVSVFGFVLCSLPIRAQAPTDPNLKVAFIGDSGDGTGFGKVLRLIDGEGVDLILHQGDFSYSKGPTPDWLGKINTHVQGIPYLGSVGNHDVWDLYYSRFFAGQISSLEKKGGRVSGDPGTGNYAVIYRGLKVVFVNDSPSAFRLDGQDMTRTQYINHELGVDGHTWRICSWHANQTAMQVGRKEDAMGWSIYEACRNQGAIIATAHEHSYQRTRTLTNMKAQTVDVSCRENTETPDPDACVAAGKTFAFVSGLGGTGIRDQDRCLPSAYPYGCNQVWAKIYTSNQNAEFGALFITFNVDGDPNKAQGYFKNIGGKVVDRFDIIKSDSGTPKPIPVEQGSTRPAISAADSHDRGFGNLTWRLQ